MSASPADGEPDEAEVPADVLATIELAPVHSAAFQELVRDACGNARAAEAAGPDLTWRRRRVPRLVQCGSSHRDIASALSIRNAPSSSTRTWRSPSSAGRTAPRPPPPATRWRDEIR